MKVEIGSDYEVGRNGIGERGDLWSTMVSWVYVVKSFWSTV